MAVYVRNYIFTLYLYYMLLEKVLLRRTFEPEGRKQHEDRENNSDLLHDMWVYFASTITRLIYHNTEDEMVVT